MTGHGAHVPGPEGMGPEGIGPGQPGGVTLGFLLGGRVRYAQPTGGLRSGIEPLLLAASVPARPGARVLEGGCGAGAGLLCLAARVPRLAGLGIEIDPAMAALAAENARANGFAALDFAAGDLLDDAPAARDFDHAFANPPYHRAGTTPSPDARRERAVRAGADGIAAWCAALARRVRPGGSITVSVPAGRLTETLGALAAAGCGGRVTFPLWPREGVAAKLVLVRGITLSRAPDRLSAGLVLHAGAGYSPAAEAILRGGGPLDLA